MFLGGEVEDGGEKKSTYSQGPLVMTCTLLTGYIPCLADVQMEGGGFGRALTDYWRKR